MKTIQNKPKAIIIWVTPSSNMQYLNFEPNKPMVIVSEYSKLHTAINRRL